ncbi:L-2-hydroxyglutarate oxidase [Microbacterium immunditiarum]|uniref:L-2-hydroxyglutarate oxidase n=1 Tax=Microbacterium immunditiarum TaxID=337480 RepID=A0A7Y9GQX4_9MICO|nr:L-2-hydroxyglutarate oxidase [Microbacterium immunditiarum]
MTTVVVGAGIVGLAVARALARSGEHVIVIEKEAGVARHQTGRNSGVIHSGLYYTPGSFKARMCVAGGASMKQYAAEHGIAHEITGKLVVATHEAQLEKLAVLEQRAIANGVPARRITSDEAHKYEPGVRCVAALRVESTGIIDYTGVCLALANEITAAGGELRFSTKLLRAASGDDGVVVEADAGPVRADYLINCAGLHSDTVAKLCGVEPDVRIIPFRGEYYTVAPPSADLVRGLIYPVPDPRFPFLGVHLTKMVDGSIHAGPNAVFAFAREGYRWRDINVADLWRSATWPGLWRLGAKYAGTAYGEARRSLSRAEFARSLSELVPGITAADLVPAKSGVRAQAMRRDGSLVDDFEFQRGPRQFHVLNAPSPAATAALEIADMVLAEARKGVA